MQIKSLLKDITYNDNKPNIAVLLETEFSKEIRLIFKKGQELKEHKTGFPIVVEIFEGEVEFGIPNEKMTLSKGGLIHLEAHIPHDVVATKDSIIRLTLSKGDMADRVAKVANQSSH